MDAVKKNFDKVSDSVDQFKCKIRTKVNQDDGQEVDKTCNKVIVVGKDSLWNLKRHLLRDHEEVMKQIEASEQFVSIFISLN